MATTAALMTAEEFLALPEDGVHRAGAAPEMFNATQELTGDPELPGFRVAVARIFGA